jgi:hypothetical protein
MQPGHDPSVGDGMLSMGIIDRTNPPWNHNPYHIVLVRRQIHTMGEGGGLYTCIVQIKLNVPTAGGSDFLSRSYCCLCRHTSLSCRLFMLSFPYLSSRAAI